MTFSVRTELISVHSSLPGLSPPDPATTFEDWWQLADEIRYREDRSKTYFTFAWGDWIRGLARWPTKEQHLTGAIGRGEGYKQLEDKTGYALRSLQNFAWLSGRYSTPAGQPDPVRGLPNLLTIHFQVCATIPDHTLRDALLWRASTAGKRDGRPMARLQLEAERMYLCPGLIHGSEPLQRPQDRIRESEIQNTLLEAAVTTQQAILAKLNGNVTEARDRLEYIAEAIEAGGDTILLVREVRATAALLEPVQVSGDIVEAIWEVIRAREAGETGLVLVGVDRLVGMKGLLR